MEHESNVVAAHGKDVVDRIEKVEEMNVCLAINGKIYISDIEMVKPFLFFTM